MHIISICGILQFELNLVIAMFSSLNSLYAFLAFAFLIADNLLHEVADTGMVELGDVQLAAYLAEKKSTQQPFFRNGMTHFSVNIFSLFVLKVLSSVCTTCHIQFVFKGFYHKLCNVQVFVVVPT